MVKQERKPVSRSTCLQQCRMRKKEGDQVSRCSYRSDKCFEFMNKPFTIPILMDTVQTLLKGNEDPDG
jgi:hypothetical protein